MAGVLFTERTARTLVKVARAYEGRSGTMPIDTQPVLPSIVSVRFDGQDPAPPYACLKIMQAEIDSMTGRLVVVVEEPDGTSGQFLFNGKRELKKYGKAYTGIVRAAFTGDTPTVGEIIGPKDSWNVERGGFPALQVMGEAETDVLVGTSNLPVMLLVKAPSGGIAPRSGGSCRSGTCEIVTSIGGNLSVDNPATIQVWNYLRIAALTNGARYGQAFLQQDGQYWALSDDCHDTE